MDGEKQKDDYLQSLEQLAKLESEMLPLVRSMLNDKLPKAFPLAVIIGQAMDDHLACTRARIARAKDIESWPIETATDISQGLV